MSFFAIAFALALEQILPLLRGNAVHLWALAWTRWCARSLDAGRSHHGVIVWAAVALLPALLAWGVHVLMLQMWGWAGAVLAFAWHVAILYVTLGFRQFSHHFSAIREALDAGDESQAQHLLAQWMRLDPSMLVRQHLLRHLMNHSAVAAHRHVFAVMGWYAVLATLGFGPAGALLYRLSELALRYFDASGRADPYGSMFNSTAPAHTADAVQHVAEMSLSSASTRQAVKTAWWWMDYVPARMTAIGFAVVGSFEDVLEAWRSNQAQTAQSNSTSHASDHSHDSLVQNAMRAALGANNDLSTGHLTSMVGVLWRSVVLWMLLIALLTLARLLG